MICPNCNRLILPKDRVGVIWSEGTYSATIAHMPSVCKKEKLTDASKS